MSGTFEHIDVPPTLVSFAVAVDDAKNLVTPEFKGAGHYVTMLVPALDHNDLPDFESLRHLFDRVHALISSGKAKAVYAVDMGGAAEGLVKMALGNRIGFKAADAYRRDRSLFGPRIRRDSSSRPDGSEDLTLQTCRSSA